jgi:hypothetical protein
VVIGAMASSIVALVLFIRHQFKEVKDAYKFTASKVEEIYEKTVKEYREVTSSNTKAINENTNETRILTQIIRERLLK